LLPLARSCTGNLPCCALLYFTVISGPSLGLVIALQAFATLPALQQLGKIALSSSRFLQILFAYLGLRVVIWAAVFLSFSLGGLVEIAFVEPALGELGWVCVFFGVGVRVLVGMRCVSIAD